MPAPNATTIDHGPLAAPPSCKCVEVNSRRYDSLISRVQRLQSELETLQDQVIAPMQELQISLQDVMVKTVASQLADHEEYMVTTMKKMLDARSYGLEQHVTGTVAQLHADLELVNQDIAWVAEQVDPAKAPVGEASPSVPTRVEESLSQPLPRGDPFASIPVKTPYKPPNASTTGGAPATAPVAPSFTPGTVGLGPRPQLPKTDEYPTYDGRVESSHREFILKIDQLKRARNLNDAEIISKFPNILKDQAGTWYTLVERKMADASWDQWKQALVDFAESHAWRTYMIGRRDAMSFPGSVPKDQARGGQWFVYELYNICDALVPNLSLGEFRSTVESKIPARLAHDLNLRGSLRPFTDIEDYIAAFADATSMYRPSLERTNDSRRDTRRPSADRPDRPNYIQRPLRLEGTFRDMRERNTATSKPAADLRTPGNRAPNVTDRTTKDPVCFNCQRPGHFARECTQATTSRTRQVIAALTGYTPDTESSVPQETVETPREENSPKSEEEEIPPAVAALSWSPYVYEEEYYDSD